MATETTKNLTAIIIIGYEEMVIEEVLDLTTSFTLPFTKNWKHEFFKKLFQFYIQEEFTPEYSAEVTWDSLKSDKNLFLKLLGDVLFQIGDGAYLVQSGTLETEEYVMKKDFNRDIPDGDGKEFNLALIEVLNEYNVSIEDAKEYDIENENNQYEFLYNNSNH